MKTEIKVKVRHNGTEVVASWVENGVTHLRVQSIKDFLDEFDGNRRKRLVGAGDGGTPAR